MRIVRVSTALVLAASLGACSAVMPISTAARTITDKYCAASPEARTVVRSQADRATSGDHNYVRVYCGELPPDLREG